MSELSIDDLWAAARASIRVNADSAKTKSIKRIADAPKALSTAALFSDPENWERVTGVALIHKESQTLLGNFSEYRHRSTTARKLIREEAPIAVTKREEVEGNWWLGTSRTIEPRKEWHEKRPAIIHLHLDKLGVHAPATEVVVHLSYGSVARVELALDTQFAADSTDREELLMLSAGTNVIEVMSRDCKIALLVEVKK